MRTEDNLQLSQILAETQTFIDQETGDGKYTAITQAQAMFLVNAGFDISLLAPTTVNLERCYLFPHRYYRQMSALLPDIFSLTEEKDTRQ